MQKIIHKFELIAAMTYYTRSIHVHLHMYIYSLLLIHIYTPIFIIVAHLRVVDTIHAVN